MWKNKVEDSLGQEVLRCFMCNYSDHPKQVNAKPSEKGQNLILIAVAMLALIGLLALVLDGGFSYATRRSAQNAADAGALAGANILCETRNTTSARTAALDYAINRNGALSAEVFFGPNSSDGAPKVITVTTVIPHDSFFAGIIGQDVVTTTALAEAGCWSPCASEGVLPVAWACTPPAEGEYDIDECEIEYGTLTSPGPLYVVMDQSKAAEDYFCQSPPNSGNPVGALDCDIDNDNEDDLIGGGGRSWLDLNGTKPQPSDFSGWIENGFNEEIYSHLWLPGIDGVNQSIFSAATARVGDVVILPVFDAYTVTCQPDIDAACHHLWHEGVDDIKAYPSESADYYHIITFALFKITGVYKNPKCTGDCTARNYLVSLPDAEYDLPANASTIEGYFVTGYVPGLEGKCNYDTAAYTIYLNH